MDSVIRPLTPATIDAALRRALRTGSDEWLPDGASRGEGRLFLRAQPTGGRWYFRYTRRVGSRDTLAMGAYAASGRTKADATGARYSLAQARDKAREYAALLKHPETANIRGHLDSLEREAERQRQAQRDADEAARLERESQRFTLETLCLIYCDHLDARGKVSAKKVRADLRRYVLHLPLAQKTSRDVTRGDVAHIVRGIHEAGKPRAAGMVRAYLSAAYTLALGAEGDAHAPASLIPFGIEANPVMGVKAIKVAQRDRHLSESELRAFLRRLHKTPGIVSDALMLCLLAGGQRPQQMLRAIVADYKPDSGELHLRDGKGKRDQVRLHVLPLAQRGRALLARLCVRAGELETPLLFTATGSVAVDVGTLSWRVTETSRAMVAAGESAEPFQMKDLRRTVETMLAALKIGKDVRAQVLSHGLSGVQAKNYDRHDYAAEKRQALARWERRLAEIENGTANKVVPIRAS